MDSNFIFSVAKFGAGFDLDGEPRFERCPGGFTLILGGHIILVVVGAAAGRYAITVKADNA